MNNKTLASVVKNAREKIGISQRELSRKTGIDNNTIAKIEKGERKKPNVLSLKKLSVVLRLELKDLMKLSGYNSNEIEATANNSYNTMAIVPDDAPVIVLDDLVKQLEDELFIKQVLKELLENSNLEDLKVVLELSDKSKKRMIKLIEKYKKENNIGIDKDKESIKHLQELLSK